MTPVLLYFFLYSFSFFLLSLSMSFSLFLSVSLSLCYSQGFLVMSLSTSLCSSSFHPLCSHLSLSVFFFSWSVRASGWLLTCLVLMEYCLRRRQRSCCGWEWWMSFTLSDQAKSPKLMIDSHWNLAFDYSCVSFQTERSVARGTSR